MVAEEIAMGATVGRAEKMIAAVAAATMALKVGRDTAEAEALVCGEVEKAEPSMAEVTLALARTRSMKTLATIGIAIVAIATSRDGRSASNVAQHAEIAAVPAEISVERCLVVMVAEGTGL